MLYIKKVKTRRQFIKTSVMTAGMLALLNACGQSVAGLKPPVDPESIGKFRKGFGGHAIIPGEKDYETSRRVLSMNPGTDKYPAVVAQCKTEQDILRCIDFAHQYDLEVSVRSGNHSFLGWGTCDNGIVIDLSQMKGIAVDPVKKTAQVTAGHTAEEILAAAAVHGLAPVLGECGSVGAGLALGGGLGWLSGRYGATCDNIISARVITANARTLNVDKNINQDLFWALRGGGGNFGIASSFEYRLHPVNKILAGTFVYPASKANAVVRFFRDFMATAPDELQGDCYLASSGKGNVSVQFVYSGDLDQGEQLIDVFRKFSIPEQDSIKRRSFSEVYRMDLIGEIISCPYESVKGSYIQHLSEEVIELILDRFAKPPPSCDLFFNLSHYMHGEVCRVATDATAFVHRTVGAVHVVFWVQWKDAANASACMSWQDKTFDLLQQYSGEHIYANYMSTKGEVAAKKTYGSNYLRLGQLKGKYDPQNFFHLNQNIQPK